MRVGEGITIRPEQGNVTKIEVAAFDQYIAMTGDNEVTGLKEGAGQSHGIPGLL